jgi:hypothetical protein
MSKDIEVIVRVPVRRLTPGVLLAGAMLAGAASPAPVAAQTSCDPSYPDVCIPPAWEAGDLECADIPYANFRGAHAV